MAPGPIETHLHRSFNWENGAPGSRIGPRGRSTNCGSVPSAQCVRLRSEINHFAKMLQTSVLNLSYFSFLKEIVSDFQHLPLTDIESTSPLYSAQKINSDTSSITSFVVINMIPLFMNAITMIAVFC